MKHPLTICYNRVHVQDSITGKPALSPQQNRSSPQTPVKTLVSNHAPC
jgi:hypothetical protein